MVIYIIRSNWMWCCLQTFAEGVVSKLRLDSHILQVILRRENTSILLIDWVAQITKFWLLWPLRRIQSSKKWMRTLRLDGKLPEILNFPITLWVSDLQNFVSDNFFFKEVVAELYLFIFFSPMHRLGNLSTFLESSQHLKGCSWVSLLKLMTNPWSCLKALMQGPLGHNAAPLVGS